MDKKIEELLGRMKAAKTQEEVLAIVKEMPRMELSEETLVNVAGGTGRIELTEVQAERVVGGGHYVTCPPTDRIWIYLMDENYVFGTDPYDDGAYFLEQLAVQGFPLDVLVAAAYSVFPHAPSSPTNDIEKALRAGGPVYLADCLRNIKPGYGF